ncbi:MULTISPECIES: hypothetical protein [Agrobacterium]|uniref:Antitoxin VbhA domain-containing protein n=1 Tax=Agrobacterium rubi TaxID=28099 RepID=A0AAE7RCP2_9HYPH|nr:MULTISPECIES: hypothetical protein [Agrobacterium]MBN7807766.1 hypothetical protein [Agrobacterium rosae]NTE89726.1 hypothetical protein [Agrobacterium rubi]NTF05424.1 hypothetical protein [Agrobacterium rubi]NTF39868.1 hypothetical protein [Agrobacterium rubi]OCJ44833.1 hypothetical protein A6U92_16460 [Agrobacterium rubi]
MSTNPETRRAIAQRVINRAAARGMPIDTDPAFVALLEEWTRGDIDMKAMRERYLDIIALQAAERRGLHKSPLGLNLPKWSDEADEE